MSTVDIRPFDAGDASGIARLLVVAALATTTNWVGMSRQPRGGFYERFPHKPMGGLRIHPGAD